MERIKKMRKTYLISAVIGMSAFVILSMIIKFPVGAVFFGIVGALIPTIIIYFLLMRKFRRPLGKIKES